MRKLLAVLLAMVMLMAVVAGCATNDDTPETPDTGDTTEGNETEGGEISAEELLQNVNARRAIAMAFDKNYITEELLMNGSIPADFLVPQSFVSDAEGNDFRSKYPSILSYNAEEALSYWNQAKEELGFETVTVELLTYDSDTSKILTEFIQGQLQDTLPGLTVNMVQQPFENKLELAVNGDFDLNFAGWGPDYPDPMTFMDLFITDGGHNDGRYSNAEYDEAITRTKTGDLVNDIAARWELLQDAEKLALDEAMIAPVYQRGAAIVQQPYVTGIVKHSFGGDYTFKTADTTTVVDGEKVIRLVDSSDIPTMDMSLATDQVSFQAAANVNEGLYMLGENDALEPGVAESYEVSEDGLTYTFTLRDNAMWSNGDAVTAEDFVYAWHRLGNPETGAQYAYMLETAAIKNASAVIAGEAPVEDLGIVALDEKTLEVTLENAVPYFLQLMSFPSFYPQNQAFVEAQGDQYGTSIETTLYNGPFVLSAWELGYEYEYAKNPNYWDPDVLKIDKVNFRIVKDTATAVNLYESGEIDRVGLTAEFVEAYMDDPNFFNQPDTALYYISFNIANR